MGKASISTYSSKNMKIMLTTFFIRETAVLFGIKHTPSVLFEDLKQGRTSTSIFDVHGHLQSLAS